MADTFNLLNPDSTQIVSQRVIQAPTSATAASLLVLDSSKNATTTTSLVIKNNFLVIQNHVIPADGDIAAGDAALWFDQTNGAGKLMVKAKTANGTVAVGSVTLS